jgi:transposase-like protein
MLEGEVVSALASELHISPGTLHRWKKQALIDQGLAPGTKSFEVDELAQARRTRTTIGPFARVPPTKFTGLC